MDGVEPELVDDAEHALMHEPGVLGVRDLKMRWIGHDCMPMQNSTSIPGQLLPKLMR